MPTEIPAANATGFRSLVEQIQEKGVEPVFEAPQRGPRRRTAPPQTRRAEAPVAPVAPGAKTGAPVRLLSRRWL